jgi:hypothetical protein
MTYAKSHHNRHPCTPFVLNTDTDEPTCRRILHVAYNTAPANFGLTSVSRQTSEKAQLFSFGLRLAREVHKTCLASGAISLGRFCGGEIG